MSAWKKCNAPIVALGLLTVFGVLVASGVVGRVGVRNIPPPTAPRLAVTVGEPSHDVREVFAQLGVSVRCTDDAGRRTAQEMVALVAESHNFQEVPADERKAVVERCYVFAKFNTPATIVCGIGGDELPVDEIVLGFRPNHIIVRSGDRFYACERCSYPCVARVQDSLRHGRLIVPGHQDEFDRM